MGLYERREREKYERRSLILETARNLILECGVDAVTMQEIADACELSKGTLYLYFENKEALLEELFNVACSYFIEYVVEKNKPETTGIEALRTLWRSYLELFGESSDVIVLFGVKNALSSSFTQEINDYLSAQGAGEGCEECDARDTNNVCCSESEQSSNKFLAVQLIQLFEKILQQGIQDGTLHSGFDPKKVARIIVMIADGIVQNIARLPLAMRNDHLISEEMRTTFEIILRGLASADCNPDLLELPLNYKNGGLNA